MPPAAILSNASVTPLAEHASDYTKTGGRGNKVHDNYNVVTFRVSQPPAGATFSQVNSAIK